MIGDPGAAGTQAPRASAALVRAVHRSPRATPAGQAESPAGACRPACAGSRAAPGVSSSAHRAAKPIAQTTSLRRRSFYARRIRGPARGPSRCGGGNSRTAGGGRSKAVVSAGPGSAGCDDSVGVRGFEPRASCPPDKRANQAAPHPVTPDTVAARFDPASPGRRRSRTFW